MRSVCAAIVATAVIALAVLSSNCQALIRIDDRYLVTDASSVCDHRQPPPPPQVVDAGGSNDLVFAIQLFEYGTELVDSGTPAYEEIGFDLDDTCTGEGQGPSCAEPDWADANHHDGVDGIDNAFGKWGYGVFEPTLTPTRATGNGLIRVRGYNGQADDDQVEVCDYASLGVVPRDDGGDGGAEPLWDGQDRWTILVGSLVAPGSTAAPDPDRPLYCDEHAYVTGNILVSHFDELYGPSYLQLARGHLTRARHVVSAGRIAIGDAGRWELQDVVTGFRVLLSDAVTYWSQADLSNGRAACSEVPQYYSVKRNLCPLADIAFDPGSPTAQCDAFSVGYRLQAKQALLGDVIDASSALAPCADAALDPTCP